MDKKDIAKMVSYLKQRETTGKCPQLKTSKTKMENQIANLRTSALAKAGFLKNPKNKITNYPK